MELSKNHTEVSFYSEKNERNIEYNVIRLYDKDLLLFGDMNWGASVNKGDICISNIILNNYEYEYIKVGNWENTNQGIQLSIPGKGIYFAVPQNNETCYLYEAFTTNPLERLSIDAIKNQPSIL